MKPRSIITSFLTSSFESDFERPTTAADNNASDHPAFNDLQVEFTQPTPLLKPDGTLLGQGWARTPLILYNPENIRRKSKRRIKEWEHYTIVTPRFAFAITIADISFATFASYEVVDFAGNKVTSGTNLMLGSHGDLPNSPLESTSYRNDDNYVNVVYDKGTRTIDANIKKSLGGCAFSCQVVMAQAPGDQNPAAAAAFPDPHQFFYENKIFGMPSSGTLTIGGRTYELDPAESFAVLDWGRGVWPHKSKWHWGFAAGVHDGKSIGFNIGDGSFDDSLGTPNAQKLDGVLHKLYRVYFDYNLPNIMEPWEVTSDGDKLRATLTPVYHQKIRIAFLGIGILVDKMYGTFDGRITLDDGSEVEFTNIFGFIERSSQRW
jgi:Domain of unknown function (DUF2804), N-terminal/Domain of unknown function (DUF2804), C-terminal